MSKTERIRPDLSALEIRADGTRRKAPRLYKRMVDDLQLLPLSFHPLFHRYLFLLFTISSNPPFSCFFPLFPLAPPFHVLPRGYSVCSFFFRRRVIRRNYREENAKTLPTDEAVSAIIASILYLEGEPGTALCRTLPSLFLFVSDRAVDAPR